MKLAKLLVTIVVLLFAITSFGQQSFMDEPGIPAFTTSFPVEHGFINIANGALHLEIPIASYPQRGSKLQYHARLVYDSRVWTFDPNNANQFQSAWQPNGVQSSPIGIGWRLITDEEGGTPSYSQSFVSCGGPGLLITFWKNFSYQEPNGTNHRADKAFQLKSAPPSCGGYQATGTAYASDNSGYKFVVTDGLVSVYAPDGTLVSSQSGSQNMQDTNGNFSSYSSGNVMDTLGRVPVITSTSGNLVFIDYLNPQGSSSRITLTTFTLNLATQFSNGGNFTGTWPALQSVVFPDNTSYQFQYDSYGQITSMTLPTGGQVAYGYTNTTAPNQVNRWLTSRIVDGNTWSFTPTFTSCTTPCNPLTVTVTTPSYNDGTTTASDNHVYSFFFPSSNGAGGAWPAQIQYFRGATSGTPLLTLTKEYNNGQNNSCQQPMGNPLVPVLIRETLAWPSGSGTLSKKAEYCYDSNGINQITKKLWDYQPNGSFAPAPDREVDTTYVTDPAYIDANILQLPLTVTSLGPGGVQVAKTTLAYDGGSLQPANITTNHITPSGPRGNLTSVSKWLNTTGGSVTSSTKWFDTGEVYQSIDPLLHTTTLSYDSAFFGAYLTKSCNALSPAQCSYNGYDFNIGFRTSSTDVNGSQAGDAAHTTNYTFDTLLRPLCTNLPDGGQTCLSYPDANHVSRTQIITSGLSDLSTTILDGLGHVSQTQHTLPDGISTVHTHYDPVGIPDTVSNPYFTTSDPTYGITQNFHDALGRTIKTVKQDGSVVVIKREDTPADPSGVSLLCTTVTDESGKTRQSCSNGFGELVKVVEPNPSSVATNATGSVTISGSEQATTMSVSITVAGSGFETPALGSGANAYQYHPTGSSWTFGPNSGFDSNNNIVGGSGITGNNSGFTSSNPAAPEGAQVAFLQGGSANYISQSLSGFQAGVSYTVSFQAAQRGSSNAGGEDFDVYLDSTFLATFNPASTSYALLSTPAFTTTAGAHTIKFVGRDSAGGNGNTAFIDAVQVTGTIGIASSGFETPAVGSGANAYQYHPTGSNWTFGPNSGVDSNNNIVGGSGLTGNNSGFTSSNPAAPEGTQVAFLQGGSANFISQSLSGFQAGVTYTISFQAAQRGNFNSGGQDFDVYLDSTPLATFRPASTNYALLSTPAFTTTAGTHTLQFVGRDSAGGNGNTAFIDAVQITGTVGIADAGAVTISVNGTPYSTSFGSGDTPTTIASRLATAISAGSYASATASGGTVNLTSKTAGTIGSYTLSASSTYDSAHFAQPSFTPAASGATLSGAYNPGDIGNNPFVTLYAYDALGNLLRVDQKGSAPSDSTQWRTRTFTYDSLSRLLTATNPESGAMTYSYDADGELLQKTSPAPNQTGTATQTVSYCYDPLHRVTGKGYGAQSCPLATPVVTYAYDSGTNGKGYLTSLADQAGSGIYGYDNMGRMTTETRVLTGVNNGAISKSASYDYNLDGSLYKLHYPSGAIVTYAPGAAGLTLSAVDSANGINYVTAATYGADSSVTGFVSGNSASFAGITNAFSYNKRLQPINMSANSPSQTVFSIGYDFHVGNGTSGANNGNVFGITNYKDTTRNQTFTYDALNRLTSAQNSGTDCSVLVLQNKTKFWGNSYVYDAWGNQLQKNITKCGAEHLLATADAQNRIHVSAPDYLYDAAGNMTTDVTDGVTAVYDPENRISTATSNGITTTYTYDSNGNRVRKSNGNLAASGTLYWQMTPGVVAETDLAGTLKSEYVFFDGERVARRDGPTGTGGVFYYFADYLKTASVITDAAGVIKAESDYYPWGGELQFVNNDSNDYKFTGKKRDTETGLDYFGARYYSNGLGRFITPDWSATPVPVPYADLEDPQTLNQYSYVRNIPTVKVDPDGHDTNGLDHKVEGFDQRMDQVDAFVVRALNHPAVQGFIEVLGFRFGGAAEEGAAAGAAKGVEEGVAGGTAKGTEGVGSNIAANAEKGAASESKVLKDLGKTKNTEAVVTKEGKSIPDIKDSKTIGEIKDAKTVSNTKQLRIQKDAAKTSQRQHELHTGTKTHVTKPAAEGTKVIRRDDLGPK
jgi:RHS repeat-associated protein